MTAPKSVKQCNSCGEQVPREDFPKPRSVKCNACHVSRVCIRCGERKPVEQFPLAGGRHKGTTNRIKRCHPCQLSDKRQHYAAAEKGQAYRRRYGMTLAERDAMLAVQGGGCAICQTTEPGGRGDWCTDHDHACCPTKSKSCGKCIRGILCFSCNVMLGCAKDNPMTLATAVEYLAAASAPRMQPI